MAPFPADLCFGFVDLDFSYPAKDVEEFCDAFTRLSSGFIWTANGRTDHIPETNPVHFEIVRRLGNEEGMRVRGRFAICAKRTFEDVRNDLDRNLREKLTIGGDPLPIRVLVEKKDAQWMIEYLRPWETEKEIRDRIKGVVSMRIVEKRDRKWPWAIMVILLAIAVFFIRPGNKRLIS